MPPRRSLRACAARPDLSDSDSNMRTRSRTTRATHYSSSVTVSRSFSEEAEKSLLLIIKMSSGKLREATSGSARAASRRNVFTEDPIVSGPRTSRPKKKMVEIDTSDSDESSDQEEDNMDDDDAPGDEDEDDEDADADADGDLDMDDAPPQPPNRRHARAAAPPRKQVKSVEAKEIELENAGENDDEEEMSDVDSDAEGEPDDDANGGVDLDEEDDLDDEGLDSDETGDNDAKMTKRQRGSLGNDFLQLPMEPQVKKHLTAEERAMRRAEMARRRKNLSEKRNEEEKMDTINRLLRKQPPKKKGRAAEGADGTPADQDAQEPERQKLDPTMIRWVSSRKGSVLSMPNEWLGTPAGRLFGAAPDGSRKLVEEV